MKTIACTGNKLSCIINMWRNISIFSLPENGPLGKMQYQLFRTICLFEYFEYHPSYFLFKLDPSQTELKRNAARMMKEKSYFLSNSSRNSPVTGCSRLRNLWTSQVAMLQLAKGTYIFTSSRQRCNFIYRDEYLSLVSFIVFQHKSWFDLNMKIHKQVWLKNKLQCRMYSTERSGCSQSCSILGLFPNRSTSLL